MTQTRMVIVGVVGGSKEPSALTIKWGRVQQYAQEIGELVAQSKNIILTGSTPRDSDKSPLEIGMVHKNAMRAAIDAGGLAIAILPKKRKQKIAESQLNKCVLEVSTMLSSYERNLINGTTPDVLIALPGGAGTVSEVKIALSAGIPVIYLHSLDTLNAQCPKKVSKILTKALAANPIVDRISSEIILSDNEFSDESKAVSCALNSAINLGCKTRYRDGLYGAPDKESFESAFQKLCELR